MRLRLSHNTYTAAVFITGACVLIVEVVATRVLSPYFGNSIYTISSVLSSVLAALSIGYYAGGRLADRSPSAPRFFLCIALGGMTLLLCHLVGMFALPLLGYSLSILTGPLVFSFVLFFIPAMLLGALSPYAVKLHSIAMPERGVGSVAGEIFFYSTLGSILGSLLAGFVLVPHVGINALMIGTGVVLVALGTGPLIAMRKYGHAIKILIALGILLFSLVKLSSVDAGYLYVEDGVYEKIQIFESATETGRPVRYFNQDRSASGAMYLDTNDPHDMVFDYTKYYELYKLTDPEAKRALVIGGGAYTIPKALIADSPTMKVDVAEIEPSLESLAKRFFSLPEDVRVHTVTMDGRRLLNDSSEPYDFIFNDVYYSLYSVPAHFTTREFFQTVKEKLGERGMFVGNMIGDLSRQEPSLIFSEMATFRSVFPNSYFFAVESPKITERQNIMFVGLKDGLQLDLKRAAEVYPPDSIFATLGEKLIDLERFDIKSYPILTDAWAPVEYLTGRVLRDLVRSRKEQMPHEALAIIEQLLRFGPRHPTGAGHAPTQAFLEAEMRTLADDVRTQTWTHTEADGVTSYELTNIVARFAPEETDRIILGTHYDSLKYSFNDLFARDRPSPGANNSASGVALLVEVARLLGTTERPLDVGVDIVFFDGEEGDENQGADFTNWEPHGSTYFAEHLGELYTVPPRYAAIFDMVCKRGLVLRKEASSVEGAPILTAHFWDIGRAIDSDVFVDEVQPTIRDDHTPLNTAGIPSFLAIDYEYPPYATTRDTPDKCSAQSLAVVGEAIERLIFEP